MARLLRPSIGAALTIFTGNLKESKSIATPLPGLLLFSPTPHSQCLLHHINSSFLYFSWSRVALFQMCQIGWIYNFLFFKKFVWGKGLLLSNPDTSSLIVTGLFFLMFCQVRPTWTLQLLSCFVWDFLQQSLSEQGKSIFTLFFRCWEYLMQLKALLSSDKSPDLVLCHYIMTELIVFLRKSFWCDGLEAAPREPSLFFYFCLCNSEGYWF